MSSEVSRVHVAVTSELQATIRDLQRLNNEIGQVARHTASMASGVQASAAMAQNALGGIGAGAVAAGNLLAQAATASVNAVGSMGSQALTAVANYERLGMSLQAMAQREMIAAGTSAQLAQAMAPDRAQELLRWIQQLAVASPFSQEDVASAFRLSMGLGLTSQQAQRTTAAMLDFAAANGVSGATMERISLAMGQINARGALMGGELLQLSQAGIGQGQVFAQLAQITGKTTDQLRDLQEKGAIPAGQALEAITQIMEKSAGAGAAQSNTFSGLIASLGDLKDVALRAVSGGTFDALKEPLQQLVGTLQDESVLAQITAFGNRLGEAVRGMLSAVQAAAVGFQAGGAGGGAAAFLHSLGIGPDTAAQVGATINQVIGIVQTGMTALRSTVAGFQAGGVSGAASGLLTSLGVDPTTINQVKAALDSLISIIQSGMGALQATIAGLRAGGLQGGATALLQVAGVDPGTVEQVKAGIGQVQSAIQTGFSVIAGIVAGAVALVTTHWQVFAGGLGGVAVAVGIVLPLVSTLAAGLAFLVSPVGLVVSAFALLGAAWTTNFANIQGIASAAIPLVVGLFQILAGVIGFLVEHWRIFAVVAGAAAGVFAVLGAAAAASGIIGFIGTLVTSLQMLSVIVAGAGSVLGVLTTLFPGVAAAIGLLLSPIGATIVIVSTLAAIWASNFGGIQEKTAGFVQATIARLQHLGSSLSNFGQFAAEALSSGNIGQAWSNFQARAQDANASLRASMAQARETFFGAAQDASTGANQMADGIRAGLAGIPENVGSFFANAHDKIRGFVGQWISTASAGAQQIKAILSSVQTVVGGQGGFGLDQGLISGATDAGSIAAKNAQFAQKTADLKQLTATFGNMGAAATGARGAAQSAEDKIREANAAIQSTIKTVTDLNEMLKSGLAGLTIGDGADQIVQLASQVAALGRRIADVFQQAATGLTEDSYKAAQALASGISSSTQALSSVVGFLPKLWEFLRSPAWGEMQGSLGEILAVAGQLAQWGRGLFDVFSSAAQGVSEEAAKASQILSQGIQAAASGISAVIGLLPKLWEFVNSPVFDAVMEAQGELVAAARKIAKFGRKLFEVFASVAAGVSADAVAAAQLLSQGIGAATQALGQIIDLVPRLLNFVYGIETSFALTGEGQRVVVNAARQLAQLGRSMLTVFAQAAAGLKGSTVAAAQRLADGINASMGALGQVADTVRKLIALFYDVDTRQIVAAESEGHLAVQHIAYRLIGIGRNALVNFAIAGQGLRGAFIAGAKVMADGIQGAMSSLSAVADSVRKLINLFYDLDTRQIVAAEAQGHLAVQHIAYRLIAIGRDAILNFAQAGQGLRAGTIQAAKILTDAIQGSMGALGQIADVIPKLINLFYDLDTRQIVAAESQGHLAVQHIAYRLIGLAQFIVSEFGAAAQGLGYWVPSGVRILSEAVTQSTGALSSLIDVLGKLARFSTDLSTRSIAAGGEALASVRETAGRLAQLAADIAQAFGDAAQGLGYWIPSGVRILSEATSQSTKALTDVMAFVDALLAFVADRMAYVVATGPNARTWVASFATNLGQLAVAIVTGFGRVAGDLTGDVIAASRQLGQAVQDTLGPMSDMMEWIVRFIGFISNSLQYALATGPNARAFIGSFATNLGQLGAAIVSGFGRGALELAGPAVAAAQNLGQAIQSTLGPMSGLMDWIERFIEFVRDGTAYAIATGPNAREWIRSFATNLGQLSAAIVSGFGSVAGDLSSVTANAAQNLADAINAVLPAVQNVLDTAKLLSERIVIPSLGGLDGTGESLRAYIERLAKFGQEVTVIIRDAVRDFALPEDSGLEQLSGAVGHGLTILQNALSLIKSVAERVKIPNTDPLSTAGVQLRRYLVNLAVFGMTVTGIIRDTVQNFTIAQDSGLEQLSGAIGHGLTILQTSLDLIKAVTTRVKIPKIDTLSTAGVELRRYLAALAAFGREVTVIVRDTVAGFTIAKDSGLEQLSGAVGQGLTILKAGLDLIKATTERVTIPPLDDLTSKEITLREYITRLVRFAMEVTNIVKVAVASFTIGQDSGIEQLAGAVGHGVSILQGGLNLIKAVTERVVIPPLNDLTSKEQPLQDYIDSLARFAQATTEIVRDAVRSFSIGEDSGLEQLAGVVGNGVSILQAGLDIIKATTERVSIPPLADLTSKETQLGEYIERLASFAMTVTVIIRDAVRTFSIGQDSGLEQLAGVVGNGLSILQGGLDIIKATTERVTIPRLDSLDSRRQSLREYIDALARFALDVTVVVRDAVRSFVIAQDSGLEQLSGAVGNGMSVLQGGLDLIKATTERVSIPKLDSVDAKGRTLRAYIEALARFAMDVTVIVRDTVRSFAIAKDSGLEQLAGVVGNGLSILQAGLDLIKALTERVAVPKLNALDAKRVQLRVYIERLAAFAQSVTEIVRDTVRSFNIGKDSGLEQLSGSVGNALTILQNGLDLIKALTERLRIPKLGDLDKNRVTLRAYITRLAAFARDVTVLVRDTVREFTLAKDSGLEQLSSAVGDALSILKDGLDIAGLIDKVLTFKGVNWQTVGPKLNLLILDLIEIARRFATQAASAGITEAYAEAGSRIASLFGDAAGALNDAIELGVKLLDPETQIPSVSQIDAKLTSLLNLIQETVTRFAERAASIGADKLQQASGLGTAVSSVMEGLTKGAELIEKFTGIYTGSSGLNNIRESLRLLFDTFEEFADKADSVNQVSAALSTILGSLANLADAQGAATGASFITGLIRGIEAGADAVRGAVRTALAGQDNEGQGSTPGGQTGAARASEPGGNRGGTVINNYYFNLTQIGASDSVMADSGQSFLSLRARVAGAS